MNVLIRNLSPSTVAKIDSNAKELGISRNEYLKNYVETLSVLEIIKDEQLKFESALGKVADHLENQFLILDKLESDFEKIVVLVADEFNIDLEDVNDFINAHKFKG